MSNILIYASAPMENLGKWTLPGRGEKTASDCGSYRRHKQNRFENNPLAYKIIAYACKNHPNNVDYVYQYCKKLICSECYEAGIEQVTERIENKLHQFKRLSCSKNPSHLSFNVLPNEVISYSYYYDTKVLKIRKKKVVQSEPLTKDMIENNPDAFNEYKRILAKIIEQVGFEAFVMFYHPVRKRCVNCGKKPYKKHLKRGDYCECENFEIGLFFSPHFHIIAFGDIGIKSNEFELQYGFTYTNHVVERKPNGFVRYRRSFDKRKGKSEVYATIRYIISHTGIDTTGNKNSYNYYGELTSRKMKKGECKEYEEKVHCPECDSHMYLVTNIDTKDGELVIPNELEFDDRWVKVRKVSLYDYKFTKHSKYYKPRKKVERYISNYIGFIDKPLKILKPHKMLQFDKEGVLS